MIIKNVSTRVIRLEDFPEEKPLLPGATVDLSKYTPAERAQSDQLEDLFTRGELLCLGFAPTSKKLKATNLQQTQLTRYGYKDPNLNSTLIPSKNMVPELNKYAVKREVPQATTAPERYNEDALDQYRYEMEYEQGDDIPAFDEKEFESQQMHSFVQVQNEDKVLTLSIDEETGATFATDLEPGLILTEFATDPGVFVDKQTYSIEEVEDKEKQIENLKERLRKKIVKRVKKKCLYPRTDGKPCQRSTLSGFDRCLKHLSDEDKEKYYAKKIKKEKNKDDTKKDQ